MAPEGRGDGRGAGERAPAPRDAPRVGGLRGLARRLLARSDTARYHHGTKEEEAQAAKEAEEGKGRRRGDHT